ncbi:MAG: tRNA (adenosine(37)-N6)-dimethylallyltransferase MiaA [Bacteroidales bacterium]|nr:tRNA (adenosine(37)-N6)-dimethylallyltransferase MiaA [Bacteroidales bacterium]
MAELVIVLGPTAVGKTAYAIDLALRYGSPVISCDSRQIYREMKIGTAPPSEEEMALVKHYFIGTRSVCDPPYTAGRYELDALALVQELFKEHDTLVMAGGSGLYIDAFCNGLDAFPDVDPSVRQGLLERLEKEGLEPLRFELRRLDPETFATIDTANRQRVVRALEVCIGTGKPFSSFKTAPSAKRPFAIRKVGLTRERQELYDRIDRRVDLMMEAGLEQEARSLRPYRDLPALNTVGYRELFGYFDGKYPLEEAVRLIKRNSRHYAKKQLTYWGRDDSIEWIML